MQATIDMNVKPKNAGQFRAYLTFQDYMNGAWSQDPLVSVNVIINEIYYERAAKNRPATWFFSGTIETRIAERDLATARGNNWQWHRQPDSCFLYAAKKPDVDAAMKKLFKK